MILERRRLFATGLASVTAGGAAWPLKSLWDGVQQPKLKGPLSDSVAEEISAERPLAMAATLGPQAQIQRGSADRSAFLHNVHTGEMLNVIYFQNGRYVAAALAQANHLLRDWRNNQQHFIHPHLFDLLHDLRARLQTRAPFQILSGYRSPSTNAMLHAHSEQVASRSQHLLGKALDITLQGVRLDHLHKAALSLRAGGVGYYPESGFVHVDVGPVRQWAGA